MTQAIRNQCPGCHARLDFPGSIGAPARVLATFRLDDDGFLKPTGTIVTRRGRYKCRTCGYRLNKFLKEVKVGIIGEEDDAAANTSADA